ncbi:GNAT family N-acetyltransferase [Capnocytophaga canimorsus]|uniref:GNAT family N-acetyltransferase n=1 Tax=Capnocytophaga canimorsus TaxID=28188 RepID=UPI0037D1AF98
MIVLQKALPDDLPLIWEIIQQAIRSRKEEGSTQWQDGYPNLNTIATDIAQQYGYVVLHNLEIIGYVAVIFDVEPAYEILEGHWLSQKSTPYMVVHRMAISIRAKGKGFAHQILQKAEILAKQRGVNSIKIDTNFDNYAMLKVLEKAKYTYCGTVYFRATPRMAFEKLLMTD